MIIDQIPLVWKGPIDSRLVASAQVYNLEGHSSTQKADIERLFSFLPTEMSECPGSDIENFSSPYFSKFCLKCDWNLKISLNIRILGFSGKYSLFFFGRKLDFFLKNHRSCRMRFKWFYFFKMLFSTFFWSFFAKNFEFFLLKLENYKTRWKNGVFLRKKMLPSFYKASFKKGCVGNLPEVVF